MYDPLKESQFRHDRHQDTDPISTRPTVRLNARVAGDVSLFENEDLDNHSSERMVIWRWQMRRRRR
jgi:hypothetical protein